VALHGSRHGRSGFSRAHDQRSAPRRRREMRGQDLQRIRGRYRGVEALDQQIFRVQDAFLRG